MRERPATVRRPHRHEWLWEPLESDPTFVLRTTFGVKAAYVGGRMMLCFCAGEEPWCGVLVCTDRERHAALQTEFPDLAPHKILPKWLYLPESVDSFERTATVLIALARRRDPRLGIIPGTKRKRPKKAASPRKRRPR